MFYYKQFRSSKDHTVISLVASDLPKNSLRFEEISEEEFIQLGGHIPILNNFSSIAEPDPIEDLDAIIVDHEYRLALLELGLNESEV